MKQCLDSIKEQIGLFNIELYGLMMGLLSRIPKFLNECLIISLKQQDLQQWHF